MKICLTPLSVNVLTGMVLILLYCAVVVYILFRNKVHNEVCRRLSIRAMLGTLQPVPYPDLDAPSRFMIQAYFGERTSGPRISDAGIPASAHS